MKHKIEIIRKNKKDIFQKSSHRSPIAKHLYKSISRWSTENWGKTPNKFKNCAEYVEIRNITKIRISILVYYLIILLDMGASIIYFSNSFITLVWWFVCWSRKEFHRFYEKKLLNELSIWRKKKLFKTVKTAKSKINYFIKFAYICILIAEYYIYVQNVFKLLQYIEEGNFPLVKLHCRKLWEIARIPLLQKLHH